MNEHTKGRMTVTDTGSDYFFSVIRLGRKDIDVKDHHIARRLAAAWNAFDGVRTEFIEAMAGTGAMQAASDSISALPAAQAELNAARALLREVVDMVPSEEYNDTIRKADAYLDACDTLEGK